VAELRRLGVQAEDIDELRSAISSDGTSQPGALGTNAKTWLGTILARVATGTYDLAIGAGADLIAAALLAYYGGTRP
jgi:hypothetical protein